MNPETGLQLERRAHRLAWHLGYLVRRRVFIYSEEATHQITDIDAIGIKFNETFNPQTILFETKSEQGFASILKLKGILDYYPSTVAYLVRPNITPDIIEFAEKLGIRATHTSRLEEIETELGIDPNDWSLSYSPEFDKRFLRSLQELRRAGCEKEVYFRDLFWMGRDPFLKLKLLKSILSKIYGAGETGNKRITKFQPIDYLVSDLTVLFSVSLLESINLLYPFPEHQRRAAFEEKLISGKLSTSEKEEFLGKFYNFLERYTEKVLKQTMIVGRNHLKLLPLYADSLYDLMSRFMKKPKNAIRLSRLLDAYHASIILQGTSLNLSEIQKSLALSDSEFEYTIKFCRDTVQFLFEGKPPHIFHQLFTE